MFCRQHIFIKAILVVAFIALLSFGPFGLSHSMMGMDSSMNSNCPFMPGMTALCNMGPLEHLAAWQGMFASLPFQNPILFLLLILCAFSLVWNLWKEFHPPDRGRVFLHLLHRRNILPAPALQELFSSGILNPKVF